jgi:importin-9
VPTQFTSIPFPVKALKILIHEVQSGGDSAMITAQDQQFGEVDSDDGVCLLFPLQLFPKE